jgi:DNA-binding transcriptional LysR family regulator
LGQVKGAHGPPTRPAFGGGLGLTYNADRVVTAHLASRHLEAVLRQFAPESSGFHLYFHHRAQTQPKPRAFIDIARRVLAR